MEGVVTAKKRENLKKPIAAVAVCFVFVALRLPLCTPFVFVCCVCAQWHRSNNLLVKFAFGTVP